MCDTAKDDRIAELHDALVQADSIMSLIYYREKHALTEQTQADLLDAFTRARRLTSRR